MRYEAIIGAGGFGREVFCWREQDLLSRRPSFVRKGLLMMADDTPTKFSHAPYRMAYSNYPKVVSLTSLNEEDHCYLCVGDPKTKKAMMERELLKGLRFPMLRLPRAMLSGRAEVGDGSILCPFSLVGPEVRLGRFVALNIHASIGHDARLGDYCVLSSHVDISGGAILEDGVFVGSGASVLPGVRVGSWATVGAGACVTKDVEPGATVVGVPARRIK